MKIVLIALPLTLGKRYTEFGGIQYPINLGYIASYLIKHGNYEIEMWDYNIDHFTEKDFADRIRKSKPDIVGIHCKTPTILIGSKFAKIIKKANPRIFVVVGGPHSTAIPERTLEEFPEFDICVLGEGEETFLELCNKIKSSKIFHQFRTGGRKTDDGFTSEKFLELQENRPEPKRRASYHSLTSDGRFSFENKKPIEGTLGIAYRTKRGVKVEARRPLIKNLDELPFPNRDLIDLKKYNIAHVERGIPRSVWTAAEIMVSRGCPFQCIYCAGNLSYGRIVRFRSAKNVIDEVKECIKKYNINYVNINDDTITLKKDLLYEICDNFKKLGIKWGCLTRVDVVTKEMLQRMVDSGCIRTNFGVESGSQKILDLTKKNIKIEQIKTAFKYAYEAGLKIKDAGFLIGQHPDETLDDVKKTLHLMKEIRPTFASVTITVPFPGTELNRMMKERGCLGKENWENFVMFGKKPEWRTKYFSSEDLVRLQKWVMRKYYLRLGYIIPKLLEIRSLNELKYYVNVGFDFIKNVVLKRAAPE